MVIFKNLKKKVFFNVYSTFNMDNSIEQCVLVINKEIIREKKPLFHKILLKKANSRLIYEMMKNDPNHNTTKYVYLKSHSHSNAFKVAHYLNHNKKKPKIHCSKKN